MMNISIQSLSVELQMSVDDLIKLLLSIGVVKTIKDFLSLEEKEILFRYINDNKKSSVFNKLILQRKTRSTLNVSSAGGKNKQVQVEVRKNRTYVQCVTTLKGFSAICSENDVVKCKNDDAIVNASLIENKSIMVHSSDDKVTSSDDDSSISFSNMLKKNSYINNSYSINFLHESCKSVQQSVDKKEYIFNKNEGVIQKDFKLNVVNDVSSNNKSHVSSSLKKRGGSNSKSASEHKNNRIRGRSSARFSSNSKLIKKKRNNHRLYDEVVSNTSHNKEEGACISNRVLGKSRRKNSLLIQEFNKPNKTIARDVILGEVISVSELANRMAEKSSHVIKVMMQLGVMVTINQIIDQETAHLVAEEMGHNVILRRENELEESIMNDRNNHNFYNKKERNFILEKRAPVVAVMGHVDHGKTSLLDYIRNTKVSVSEVGNITQSIGAYRVHVGNSTITFLDTPGHAAFSTMRARGVKLTDIVVLIVAADDGVMPQTIEAIQHIKAYNVPVVVAINKIDKLEANPDKVRHELGKYGLVPENWGGDTQFVNVSATFGQGVDALLDAILVQSEVLELKVAHHGLMARAVVIDSFLDKGKGPVITVLVQEGTLRCGDMVLCGTEYGRIRAMQDEFGLDITMASPSVPVKLLGLSGIPESGSIAVVVRDEKKAREVALYRQGKFREIKLTRQTGSNLENFYNVKKDVINNSELNLVIKSGTKGSIEAICESLLKLSTKEVSLKILSASIGGITATDVTLAVTSHAIVLGFNVRADYSARRIIELERLDVRYYSVIYDLLDDMKQVISGMLQPKYKYEIIGLAEIRNVFSSQNCGKIAGCIVIEGTIFRNKKIRVVRNNIVIYNGELDSLRRFKDDVNEVKNGVECGISIKNYNDFCVGDMIESFNMIKGMDIVFD